MKEEIGTYRKNQKGFGFVKLEGQEEEIYISKENSYNALNGDIEETEFKYKNLCINLFHLRKQIC